MKTKKFFLNVLKKSCYTIISLKFNEILAPCCVFDWYARILVKIHNILTKISPQLWINHVTKILIHNFTFDLAPQGPSVQSASKPKSENETSLHKSQSGSNHQKVPHPSFKDQETTAVASKDSTKVLAPSTSKKPTSNTAKAKHYNRAKVEVRAVATKTKGSAASDVAREAPSGVKTRHRHPAEVDDKQDSSTGHFVVDIPSRHLVRQVILFILYWGNLAWLVIERFHFTWVKHINTQN